MYRSFEGKRSKPRNPLKKQLSPFMLSATTNQKLQLREILVHQHVIDIVGLRMATYARRAFV